VTDLDKLNGNNIIESQTESIEILPVTLLNDHRNLVNELRMLARSLGLDFGWHYLLDLIWIITKIGDVSNKRIIDAGAGTGLIQWYLADHGAEVLSIDRASRVDLPLRYRSRFRVSGLRDVDLMPAHQVVWKNMRREIKLSNKLRTQTRDLIGLAHIRRSTGRVVIYSQDLVNLEHIKDNSIDTVVAVSSLEHNEPDNLIVVVKELMRVLKPGGVLLATLGAARGKDWYHKPSSGWCYTDSSLRQIFSIPTDVTSNYDRYDELLNELRGCAELRDNLADFYFQSGDNGMPWGVWDPKYQPVGVCKIKK